MAVSALSNTVSSLKNYRIVFWDLMPYDFDQKDDRGKGSEHT